MERIRELLSEPRTNVVIFTNQRRLAKSEAEQAEWVRKVRDIHHELVGEIPAGGSLSWYVATGKNRWRKPMTGMWEDCVARSGGAINLGASFYVGDAAGRPRDFSAGDAKFAKNIGVRFYTPEMYFADEAEEPVELK